MTALAATAATLAAGGIGRVFFCALRIETPLPDPFLPAALLVLTEPVLGRVTAIEARQSGRHCLVLARHAGAALTQIALTSGHSPPEIALDGEAGSLRLVDGRLLRHRDQVEPVALSDSEPPLDAARFAALRAALQEARR